MPSSWAAFEIKESRFQTDIRKMDQRNRTSHTLASSYHLSRFAHVLVRGSTLALYHSFWQQPIFLKNLDTGIKTTGHQSELVFSLLDEHPSLFSHFLSREIIVPNNKDEDETVKTYGINRKDSFQLCHLYLGVSSICNMLCQYCFLERREDEFAGGLLMTESIAFAAIDNFSKTRAPHRNPSITFYGGEPLLNQPVILSSLEHIEALINRGDLPCTTQISVITNGSYLTETLAQGLRKHKVSVSVSIDGFQPIHDASRIRKDGKSSFESVINACKTVKSVGIPLVLSCTVTKLNVGQLQEIVRWFIQEFEPIHLALNPPLNTKTFGVSKSEMKEFARCSFRAYKIARNSGIVEEYIARKAKALIDGSIIWSSCASGGDQVIIFPDGSVGPCQRYLGSHRFFKSNALKVGFDKLFNDELFQRWRNRSPLINDSCFDCIALANCGGGCACNVVVRGESLQAMDQIYCEYSKTILEELIWDIFDSNQI